MELVSETEVKRHVRRYADGICRIDVRRAGVRKASRHRQSRSRGNVVFGVQDGSQPWCSHCQLTVERTARRTNLFRIEIHKPAEQAESLLRFTEDVHLDAAVPLFAVQCNNISAGRRRPLDRRWQLRTERADGCRDLAHVKQKVITAIL